MKKSFFILLGIFLLCFGCGKPKLPDGVNKKLNIQIDSLNANLDTLSTPIIEEPETFSDICSKVVRFNTVSYIAGQGDWRRIQKPFCFGFTKTKIYVFDNPLNEVGTEKTIWKGSLEIQGKEGVMLGRGEYIIPEKGGIGTRTEIIETVTYRDGNFCFNLDGNVYCEKIPRMLPSIFRESVEEEIAELKEVESERIERRKPRKPDCKTKKYWPNDGDTYSSIQRRFMQSYNVEDIQLLNDNKSLKVGIPILLCTTRKPN